MFEEVKEVDKWSRAGDDPTLRTLESLELYGTASDGWKC